MRYGMGLAIGAIGLMMAGMGAGVTLAQDDAAQSSPSSPSLPPSPVVLRLPAPEARQGVASDGAHVFAIDNDRIGKYRISTGERIGQWQGERRLFPHMNSCTVAGRELVCAASNYPAVPQTSAVEIFDTKTLRHLRTVSLGFGPGSLTVLDRHDGKWWAVFANYAGRGGEPNRDYRYTLLVRMDDAFRQEAAWTFPQRVLDRFAPFSCSGASWSADGRLYVTGHDRPEMYELALPQAGSVLEWRRTIGIAAPGQAIDWDPVVKNRLWALDRKQTTLVASTISDDSVND